MVPRYTHPDMAAVWSAKRKFELWLAIELAATEAMARLGRVPHEDFETLLNASRAIRFDDAAIHEIDEIEKVTRHDVIAFLTFVERRVGPASRHLHVGMTSSDVLDTQLAVQLKESGELLLVQLDKVLNALKRRAYEHKHTVCVGRSHGIHAEPVTFGFKLAVYYDQLQRDRKRLVAATESVATGKVSGAVGTFAHLPPEIEDAVCARLGIKAAPISTQVVQRDRHAEFFMTLSLVGASLESLAVEIRHLQRTEVNEAEEYFHEGQKGSSAMPHKRNPVLSENITGLARLLRGYALAAIENVPLWHERDISHSSVERVIGPDACIALDFALRRAASLIDKLVVYPQRMQENLDRQKGLIYSQTILLALVDKGCLRQQAYELVQKNAMVTFREGVPFKQMLLSDPKVGEFLSDAEIEQLFDPSRYVRNVDVIFQRVFGPVA
jgi:adenylosuccinate lyase